MARQDHRHQPNRHARITAAAISGMLAGLTRVILDTVLQHLTNGC